jgi:hypothetical protein
MAIIAKPLGIAWRNLGEYNYKIGVEVIDENGDPVEVTGDVKILYIDTDGTDKEFIGSKSDNLAYYNVEDGDFAESATYRYWVQCFDKDIYGPYELKIQDV